MTDNINLNTNQNNNFTHNFFEYLSQKKANNIINYFQIPNINNYSNNQISIGKEQKIQKEKPYNNNLFNLGTNDNNHDIYQIKKNNRITTSNSLNKSPIKVSFNNDIIKKMTKKRKDNIN